MVVLIIAGTVLQLAAMVFALGAGSLQAKGQSAVSGFLFSLLSSIAAATCFYAAGAT